MGQALSSCAPCCSMSAQENEEPYQMAVDNACRQWKEKISTNQYEIVFTVDPKSSEEEIAAKLFLKNISNSWYY